MENISNEELLEQIRKAKKNCIKKLNKVEIPESLSDVLDQLQKRDQKELVKRMVHQLESDSSFWCDSKYTGIKKDFDYKFIGYEWYYDGSETPAAMGYGGENCAIIKLSNGGYKVKGGCNFTNSGGFALDEYCAPLFDVVAEEGSEYDPDIDGSEAVDLMVELYQYELFEILHLAWVAFSKSEHFKKLKTARPFYFSANNHDDPFYLIFVIS